MKETFSVHDLYHILKKRVWLIILITVFSTAITGFISFFILTPYYYASTQILVNQAKSSQQMINAAELQTNLQLINTYNVIIKSPAILNIVKDKLQTSKTTDELNSQIMVESQEQSQVISINVLDPNPYVAAEIANTTAKVFQSEIVKIMNVDNVSILSQADVKANPTPVKPRPSLNTAIAFMIGLFTSVGLAFLLEYLDHTLKNEQDIEQYLAISVLGAVSTMKKKNNEKARGKTVGV